MKKKQEEIIIPNKLSVFTDKRTGARTVAFPFDFPSGKHGVCTVTNLDDKTWQPSDDIETVLINFKNEN